MKTLMKPIYIVLLFAATSCVDDITSLNKNPKAYQTGTVPGSTFFSNATRNLVDVVTYGTTPANFSPGMTFKILAQQFAEATYFDASSYNLVNVGNGFWVTLYKDVLRDYKEAKTVIEPKLTDPLNTDEELIAIQNQLNIIEILEVYSYSILVNTYGDIPYAGAKNASLKSEALDSDNITPAYDDAAAVYDDLFVRLDDALESLNEAGESFGGADLIYGGDVSAWKKFGYSLKLRMAMTLAGVNESKAKAEAESAAPFVFESNDDNALLAYLGTTPNTNPIWVGLIQSQRFDYVASNTLLDLMQGSTVEDPRIPLYYTTDKAGGYSAGTYGKGNSYDIFSHPGAAMTQKTTPGVLLDYAEVEFYLAEAVARNFAVGGTVAEHYVNGIKASIDYWGGDSGDATAFLADPSINYATASGTSLQKIARQKYIAMFNRGLEAWTEYRRLDYPALNAPPVANGDFPIRFTYPNSEQTANGENYTAAASAIGGDVVTNKVFWDVD